MEESIDNLYISVKKNYTISDKIILVDERRGCERESWRVESSRGILRNLGKKIPARGWFLGDKKHRMAGAIG